MSTQLDLNDLYTISHTDDPDTSHAAAASLGTSRQTMARQLLAAFAQSPMTAEEASEACGYTAWAGRKRVTDLKQADLIDILTIDGQPVTRMGDSGRRAQVLTITDAGRRALTGHHG